jgi:hypothetical protein
LRSGLDLSDLKVTLTLSNTPTAMLEKFQPIFSRMEIECVQIQNATLQSTNSEAIATEVPKVVNSFRAALGDSLKPMLNEEQT